MTRCARVDCTWLLSACIVDARARQDRFGISQFGCSATPLKAKIRNTLQPPTAGDLDLVTTRALDTTLRSLRTLVAGPSSSSSTDRGHRHSGGVSEILIWLSIAGPSGAATRSEVLELARSRPPGVWEPAEAPTVSEEPATSAVLASAFHSDGPSEVEPAPIGQLGSASRAVRGLSRRDDLENDIIRHFCRDVFWAQTIVTEKLMHLTWPDMISKSNLRYMFISIETSIKMIEGRSVLSSKVLSNNEERAFFIGQLDTIEPADFDSVIMSCWIWCVIYFSERCLFPEHTSIRNVVLCLTQRSII